MQVLVTGGLGFIGSNFIRHILGKYPQYNVTNLDKITYAGNPENLRDIEKNKNYSFVKGDICDAKIVDKLVEGKDIVLNFAAETHVDRSIDDPKRFIRTDVDGTHTLLEASRKHNIKKFIQVSTDEVYGSIEKGSFTEESALQPNSPYSASKAGGDLIARSYNKTFGVPVIITRSSNNFGQYQYPEKLLPLFITNLLEGKKVPVYGDGLNVRDWLYVIDNCEAIDFIMHKGAIGEIYNIGADNEKTNIEITKLLLSELGKDESSIEYVKDRPGHDRRYSINSSKLRKLGWRPRFKFEQALKDTVKWYKNNQNWWKKIKSGEYKEYYRKHYY
ncbi:dTDP-glucose 4,6-dehydratase [Candidatus Woesearchaeota archaeon]|nr:dTDP-glucose 4,6-dehydratase [Candidatus Woesearchaeota archaeon]